MPEFDSQFISEMGDAVGFAAKKWMHEISILRMIGREVSEERIQRTTYTWRIRGAMLRVEFSLEETVPEKFGGS